MEKDDETPGQRIERIAAAQGKPSGAALAQMFGVSFETLRKWRTGVTHPNRNRQAKISEVLGVPAEAYMHGVVAPDKPESWQELTGLEGRLVTLFRDLPQGDRREAVRYVESLRAGHPLAKATERKLASPPTQPRIESQRKTVAAAPVAPSGKRESRQKA